MKIAPITTQLEQGSNIFHQIKYNITQGKPMMISSLNVKNSFYAPFHFYHQFPKSKKAQFWVIHYQMLPECHQSSCRMNAVQ